MQTDADQIEFLFLASTLIVLIFVLLIIVFVMNYQRKVLNQKNELKAIEAEHRLELLGASLEARELEQARIAKDLHDDIGALLSTAKLHSGQIANSNQIETIQNIGSNLQEVLNEGVLSVRRIVNDLLPPTLQSFGLKAAVEELTTRVNQAQAFNLQSHFNWTDHRLPKDIEVALYRMSQEMVNNTLKHAQAERAMLDFALEEDVVHLEYRDNGVGFDPSNNKKNLGLQNLSSRSEVLNGRFTYETAPGKGFKATIEIPLKDEH